MKTCHCSQLSGSCLIIIFNYRDCKRVQIFIFDPGKCVVNIPGHGTHDGKKMESLWCSPRSVVIHKFSVYFFLSFIYCSVQVSLVVARGHTHPMASVILVPYRGLNP